MGDPSLQSAQDTKNQTKTCLLPCTFQSETVTVTTANYPNWALFSQRKDACLTLQKLARLCDRPFGKLVLESSLQTNAINCDIILKANNTEKICEENDFLNTKSISHSKDLVDFMVKYARDNLAVVTIFIKDPFYTSILREEEIPFITFLGNIGGLLGFLLGMSLISCFEVFYYVIGFASLKLNKLLCNESSVRRS
jgi:hypothetical protein